MVDETDAPVLTTPGKAINSDNNLEKYDDHFQEIYAEISNNNSVKNAKIKIINSESENNNNNRIKSPEE